MYKKFLKALWEPNTTCLLAELRRGLEWNPTFLILQRGGQGPERSKITLHRSQVQSQENILGKTQFPFELALFSQLDSRHLTQQQLASDMG